MPLHESLFSLECSVFKSISDHKVKNIPNVRAHDMHTIYNHELLQIQTSWYDYSRFELICVVPVMAHQAFPQQDVAGRPSLITTVPNTNHCVCLSVCVVRAAQEQERLRQRVKQELLQELEQEQTDAELERHSQQIQLERQIESLKEQLVRRRDRSVRRLGLYELEREIWASSLYNSKDNH